MSSRYLTNITLLLAGAFLVVMSLAFGANVFQWIMLGIGIVSMLLSCALIMPRRGLVQRGLDGAITILGAWTIVASMVFSGSTVTWLGFASGIAFAAFAVAGLTIHELFTERVVHSIEVRAATNAREYAATH